MGSHLRRKRMTNKKIVGGILGILLVFSFVLAGCDNSGDGDGDVWLAELSNPMIGTWKSDADEDGSILIFKGKTDGTFEYEMQNLPSGGEYPEKGTGAYLVRGADKVIVAYFDFGLIKSIQFKVKDNNTIETKEMALVNGQKYFGETITYFHRQGAAASTADQPTVLPDNIFTAASWGANIPEPEIPDYSYPSTWEFKHDGTVVCTFIGLGPDFGLTSPDAPFTFYYTISDDRLVLLAESPEGSEIRIYQFEEAGDEITITRMALVYDGLFDVGQSDPAEPAFNFTSLNPDVTAKVIHAAENKAGLFFLATPNTSVYAEALENAQNAGITDPAILHSI
jgi:hypothetical protein